MKKGMVLFVLVFSTITLACVLFIFVIPALSDIAGEGSSYGEQTLPSYGQDNDDFTEASCLAVGGTWNSCGSACRRNPEAICIELCVASCECQTDFQCPPGYTCKDVVDGVGVCL
jgi:hypothetical protein